RYDVLAVELSSYQLHWAPSLRAHSGAVLNLAPDHLDWHGSMEAYAADKGRIYEGNRVACVYNLADKATEDLVREADVEEGCRAVGFTLGTPRDYPRPRPRPTLPTPPAQPAGSRALPCPPT
ncbi:Mur ligase family protein, partial [Streptomyces sp. NPDC127044]